MSGVNTIQILSLLTGINTLAQVLSLLTGINTLAHKL